MTHDTAIRNGPGHWPASNATETERQNNHEARQKVVFDRATASYILASNGLGDGHIPNGQRTTEPRKRHRRYGGGVEQVAIRYLNVACLFMTGAVIVTVMMMTADVIAKIPTKTPPVAVDVVSSMPLSDPER